MRTEPLAAINSLALASGTFDRLNDMLEYALAKVLEVVNAEAAGGTEAPDETAQGEWLDLVTKRGLSYLMARRSLGCVRPVRPPVAARIHDSVAQ